MKQQRPATANQPQVTDQRIYGSRPVPTIEGASNQPRVLHHTKVYGVKVIPTIRVTSKGGDEMIIDESSYDSAKHDRLLD